MNQKRIHVLCILKTNDGGTWILPQVKALLAQGARVSMLIPAGPGRLRRELDRVPVAVLESPFDFRFMPTPRRIGAVMRIRRMIRNDPPDVIFYHLYASALTARITSLGSGIPRVHMIAGPLYLDSFLIRSAERLLCRLDDVIIAGSQHTAGRYAPFRTNAASVACIPYGVDLCRYMPASPAERQRQRGILNVPSDAFVAVMVAYVYAPKRLTYRRRGIKGHEVLLSAWQRFHAQHQDARLLIVGGGFGPHGEAYKQSLIDSVQPNLSEHGITWMDTVQDVRPLYAAADVSVAPSLSENHGSALEAGACGVPSIVSEAGGLPETVTTTSGWIVPKENSRELLAALEAAYSEAAEGVLRTRGQAARAHVASYFDQRDCSVRIADVVIRASNRNGCQ